MGLKITIRDPGPRPIRVRARSQQKGGGWWKLYRSDGHVYDVQRTTDLDGNVIWIGDCITTATIESITGDTLREVREAVRTSDGQYLDLRSTIPSYRERARARARA